WSRKRSSRVPRDRSTFRLLGPAARARARRRTNCPRSTRSANWLALARAGWWRARRQRLVPEEQIHHRDEKPPDCAAAQAGRPRAAILGANECRKSRPAQKPTIHAPAADRFHGPPS